jgi:hypothetical protein
MRGLVDKANVFVTTGEYRRYFLYSSPARTFVAMSSWSMEFDSEIEYVALARGTSHSAAC